MAHTFTLTQTFPASLEKVLAARERRYEDVSKQEGLNKQELLDRREEGSIIISKRSFSLADKIPDAIKSLVPKNFLQLTENSRFDRSNNTNRFEVEQAENPGRLKISGFTRYIAENDRSSRREYEITITINIALVGGLVESQLASSYRKGLERDFEVIKGYL